MEQYKFKLNGKKYTAEVEDKEDDKLEVTLNGVRYEVAVERQKPKLPTPVVPPIGSPVMPPQQQQSPVQPSQAAPASSAGAYSVKSPLPGVVLDVKVRVGDKVQPGQAVIVLESMKMENNIESPEAGEVAAILKQKGDSVMEGDVLIQLK